MKNVSYDYKKNVKILMKSFRFFTDMLQVKLE